MLEDGCFVPQNGQKTVPASISFPQLAQKAKITQTVVRSIAILNYHRFLK
jgi:hypothetical protein